MEHSEVSGLLKDIIGLKELLQRKEEELLRLVRKDKQQFLTEATLSKDDIERFSRQIILPGIGCEGQLALKVSSILIVGVGGLGCPAAHYLAGAGVGHIGLVDYDEVEKSNLHRQLLHSEGSIGVSKVSSAALTLKKINSSLKISEHHLQLNSCNAVKIVEKYDAVIDASDNVATRYLLNDVCILSGKPLISGSALRLEGQLTVYNHNKGPCYRCIFPKPPPPETVTNCGDGGVLGAVPGVIGVLQALETIKVVLKWSDILSGQMLLFDAASCTFRKVRLRPKNPGCDICGESPSITSLVDYEEFCQAKATDKDNALSLLGERQRVNPQTLQNAFSNEEKMLLIDVRSPEEFEMCALPQSVNVPLKNIDDHGSIEKITNAINQKKLNEISKFPVYVVCRRGNDSQKAVLKLDKHLKQLNVVLCDLEGGLHAWAREVDPHFPVY